MLQIYPISFYQNKKKNSSNPVISMALEELKKVQFLEKDVNKTKSFGAIPPFKNGKEIYNFIKDSNTKIVFEKLENNQIHAQWDFKSNTIKINSIYSKTKNPTTILAISSAIAHEAGHAKDKDSNTSIQEELDCLAMNALSHHFFKLKYPTLEKSNTSDPIVNNGVELYSNLFFEEKNSKKLAERVKDSYKDLPAGDFMHPPSVLAYQIKKQ